jgi:hypothetical protein
MNSSHYANHAIVKAPAKALSQKAEDGTGWKSSTETLINEMNSSHYANDADKKAPAKSLAQ